MFAGPKWSNINTSDVNNAKDALSGLVTRVKEIARASDSVGSEPAKYYAVFRMDGDDMGKHIERAQSIADHRQLSQTLCDFSLRNAPAAVETSHLGKVIYFGGDEGVAFVSLQDLLPAIDGCRKDFGTALSGQNATACIGAVVAHHQLALLQVLREVRGTVERAKELKDVDGRKDGFCIGIMKRSGGITY
ncbi:CRISPR-associated protein Cmr2, partial [Candidatus Hakubella thermalkaliphila]